jgi:hypothetical protein
MNPAGRLGQNLQQWPCEGGGHEEDQPVIPYRQLRYLALPIGQGSSDAKCRVARHVVGLQDHVGCPRAERFAAGQDKHRSDIASVPAGAGNATQAPLDLHRSHELLEQSVRALIAAACQARVLKFKSNFIARLVD